MRLLARPLALALTAAALWLAAAPAFASHYTIYIERQRGRTLTLEHNPVPPTVARRVTKRVVTKRRVVRPRVVRRAKPRHYIVGYARSEFVRNPAIAGGCREGGLVHRRVGPNTLVLQREICHDIHPRIENYPDRF